MKLLLDTCTFLWIVSDDPRLSPMVRAQFSARENEVFLSPVSAWEISIKHRLKKLQLPCPPDEFVPVQPEAHGITELPLHEHAALFDARLPTHHRDPFDRMLICQALAEGAVLATPDPAIARYPVPIYW